MIRTIFTLGLFAVLGLLALKLAFGVFGFLMTGFLWLAGLALKIALIGGAAYLVVRIVSPDTARRLRDRWSGRAVY